MEHLVPQNQKWIFSVLYQRYPNLRDIAKTLCWRCIERVRRHVRNLEMIQEHRHTNTTDSGYKWKWEGMRDMLALKSNGMKNKLETESDPSTTASKSSVLSWERRLQE